jgi:hypothetical protein
VLPTPEQGIGIFFACVGISVLLFFAGRVGWRNISLFGLNFNRPRDKTPDEIEAEREAQKVAAEGERRQLSTAFLRYSEAAVAMVPMVEATGPANASLGAWFDVAAAAIAAALTLYPEDHYRVAIWADLGDPEAFTILGSANHIRNDPQMRSLSKQNTIGGHAWRSRAGEYLCVDIAKDRKFKSRSKRAKPYKAIFAIRVGSGAQPWGVVTIDAPRQSFGEQQLVIARRFARLVSAGASIAIARYGPGQGPSSGRGPAGPARIVGPAAGNAELTPGETVDDQSG